MIVLDTNVLWELMRQQPADAVLAWADQLNTQEVAITAMNEAEILHGIARQPDSLRKQQLQQGWDSLLTRCSSSLCFRSTSMQPIGSLPW